MTARDGPLQSWYDIHEALRNELPRLRALARDVRVDDAQGLEALSDEVVFFADVLMVHSLSEDGVGFPIMRHRGIVVSPELTQDHHRELATLYDIRRACLELRYHDDGQDVSGALDRVRQLLEETEEDLLAHIEAEDNDVIPRAAAALSPEEQMSLVIKMVAHTPAWLGPRLLPWMVTNISRDHRVQLLKAWSDAMPPAVFETRASIIRDGIDDTLWNDLVSEVPDLARLT